MYKHHYSHFFKHNPGKLHFTAHSHHPWPDVTREAHLRYWEDSAAQTDQKWDKIFGEVVPEAQKHLARVLKLPVPEQICFAPNTLEFVYRLLSCFEPGQKLRILTSDCEFHSFARQSRRLEELENVYVERVAVEPFDTFEQRLLAELNRSEFDLIFLSHVFFVNGFALTDLQTLVDAVKNPRTLIAIDGYHAFMALPVDLGPVASRIFYLGGGYKYAQSGEGCCFMWVPPHSEQRPLFTGWFADFANLESLQNVASKVGYGAAGARFWGATFDASGLYRLNAVMRWLSELGLSPAKIHDYVLGLQACFLEHLRDSKHPDLRDEKLLLRNPAWHGHFFTFRADDAGDLSTKLSALGISTDYRGPNLRFGFGLHQDRSDITDLFQRISGL
ncbi:MAG: aminotransferase class V-fold PLP-dependent enzyme [Oligoflexia bacterium]|nr:aminotransferase class V-fold PLP-dependent enzyme [Oligoflexia bacterium]